MFLLFFKLNSKKIELFFPDFANNNKSEPNFVPIAKNNDKLPEKPKPLKIFNFDGLVIEMISRKEQAQVFESKPKPSPFVIGFSHIDIVKETMTDSPQKPKQNVAELNMNDLKGSLDTMKFLSDKYQQNETLKKADRLKGPERPILSLATAKTINTTTVPSMSVVLKKSKPIKLPVEKLKTFLALDDTVIQPENHVEPPPVTENDWKVFKQFSEIPEPAQPCYNKLLEMNESILVQNQDDFVCSICKLYVAQARGVVLKSCLHNFCRLCLINVINSDHDAMGQVKCPFPIINCQFFMKDEEIKALLGVDFETFAKNVMSKLEENMRQEEAAKNDRLPALLNSDKIDFIETFEVFKCTVCCFDAEIGEGVIIKGCLHEFCKNCLIESIKHSEEFEVKCPETDCKSTLEEREVRGLAPTEIFDKHLEKSLKLYKAASETAVHCKTPDCQGWVEADKNVRGFTCESCKKVNCIGCKAIHQGKNCQEYQDEVNPDGRNKRETEESENAIRVMIATGKAMYCPKCNIPVTKDEGCDYIQCTTCRLGICWITRKPRHAITKEDGTIIDGCHCNERGKKCHPMCGTCH